MSDSRSSKNPFEVFGENDIGNAGDRAARAQREREREEQLRAQEKQFIDNLLQQNDALVAENNTLSEKITKLIEINKQQEKQIEELKLENENLLSMCGNQQAKPAPAPGLFSNLFSMRK